MMFNGMCGVQSRKLAFEFAEANNLQNLSTRQKMAATESSKPSRTL